MKKSYFTSAILLASCISFAQPVLNATDFTNTASVLVYPISNTQLLSPGTAGTNQVWDFSTAVMPTEAYRMITVIPVSGAPNADIHSLANYCEYSYNFQGHHGYSYFDLSPTGYELVGEFWESWNMNWVLTNPETVFQFPYTYNTVITDTYQTENQDSSSITTIYDAYGTLIMPYGTYNNVIRQKRTESGLDSYTFFTANPFSIIVEGSFSPIDSYPYAFYLSAPLSVNETGNENLISVYPNPANTILNLKMANDRVIDKVVITDLTGKIVSRQNENTNLINVQTLSNGVYILQVFSGNEKYQAKFIKE